MVHRACTYWQWYLVEQVRAADVAFEDDGDAKQAGHDEMSSSSEEEVFDSVGAVSPRDRTGRVTWAYFVAVNRNSPRIRSGCCTLFHCTRTHQMGLTARSHG